MRKIIITIDPTGGTKIETKGYSGPACKAATKELEAALGKVTSDKTTAEYHQTAREERRLTQ